MTAVQEDGTVSPQFAHAVRGYDRFQVDEYVERLNEWATGAQARAVEAEQLAAERAEELRRLHGRVKELEADRPATPAPAAPGA